MGSKLRYVLGLDIGVASLGVCVRDLDNNFILEEKNLLFPKLEAKDEHGKSFTAIRRCHRSVRRTVRRKTGRLVALKRLLVSSGFITRDSYNSIFRVSKDLPNVYDLRVKALDESLTNEELIKVLHKLIKCRGFKSNRKVIDKEDKDTAVMKNSIKENKSLLSNYRTVGEMLFKDSKFSSKKRNGVGNYTYSIDRDSLYNELFFILNKQKEFNALITDSFIEKVLDIFSYQKPYASGDQIKKLIGKCSIYKDELRASKCSYTAERFVLLQKVNNLSYYQDYKKVRLNELQRSQLVDLAYNLNKISYKQIRDRLNLNKDIIFIGEKKASDTYISLEGHNIFKRCLGKDYLTKFSTDQINTIADALTFYKTDKDIIEFLSDKGFASSVIDKVLGISDVKGSSSLSYKAMVALLPYLESGYFYSSAMSECGFLSKSNKKYYKLPAIDSSITNKVVYRALCFACREINNIIFKYGSPYKINIELARDGAKSNSEKLAIQNYIEKNEKDKKEQSDFISKYSNHTPSSDLMEKCRLFDEQEGVCIYSGVTFTKMDLVLHPERYEIDHILPYSRSFDNSRFNKVLVLQEENQNKSNRSPFEYFSEYKPEKWEAFVNRVDKSKLSPKKKSNLLNDTFEEQEQGFLLRNLNDTRYICKYLANFIKSNLKFLDDDGNRNTVTCVNGRMVTDLRHQWGFNNKDRSESTHHAVDAAIISAITDDIVHKISNHYRYHEQSGASLPKTPMVWDTFKDDVVRLKDNVEQKVINKTTGGFHGDLVYACIEYKGVRYKRDLKSLSSLIDCKFSDSFKDFVAILREVKSLKKIDKSDKNLFRLFKESHNLPIYEALLRNDKDFLNKKVAKCDYKIGIWSKMSEGMLIRGGVVTQIGQAYAEIYEGSKGYYAVPITYYDCSHNIFSKKDMIKDRLVATLHNGDLIKLNLDGKIEEVIYKGIHVGGNSLTYVYNNNDKKPKNKTPKALILH